MSVDTHQKRQYEVRYICPHTNVAQILTVDFIAATSDGCEAEALKFARRIAAPNAFRVTDVTMLENVKYVGSNVATSKQTVAKRPVCAAALSVL